MNAQHRPLRDYAVIVFVILCLLVGWFIKSGVENQVVRFSDAKSGISFSYPATWLRLPEAGAIVAVTDPQSPGAFKTKLVVETKSLEAGRDLAGYIGQSTVEQGDSLSLYRVISMSPFELNGNKGMRREYAYAVDPIGVASGATSIPQIVRAYDIIVPKGDQVCVFTLAAGEVAFTRSQPSFTKILGSFSIH